MIDLHIDQNRGNQLTASGSIRKPSLELRTEGFGSNKALQRVSQEKAAGQIGDNSHTGNINEDQHRPARLSKFLRMNYLTVLATLSLVS